ncbi:MAG TPA: hypothetical protein VGF77_08115 [Allosphingosinicella sp.]|jgi:hypothetical protein
MGEEEGGALLWWQTWWGAGAIVLLCAVPLLWPSLPPLVDLPGHMAAFRVELDRAHSPSLQHYYSLHWAVIGNLGLNLLVIPLSKLFGLEPAVKWVMLCVPPMTAAGFLWTAREAHGRIPATALFAIPFTYCYPFIFGFANFVLSEALCFLAFGLWLMLARKRLWLLRSLIFVPIGGIVWAAHTTGWGTLGILAFSAEWMRRREQGLEWKRAGLLAALLCLSLCLPVLLMLIWRSGDVAGTTGGLFNLLTKANNLFYALRDRWWWFDMVSILLVLALLLYAIFGKATAWARGLAVAAILLGLIYVLLPQRIFGSSYADMRLLPYTIATALIAIRPLEHKRLLAAIGLAFVFVRMGAETMSFLLYDRTIQSELAALDHVPRGARLISFVGTACRSRWPMTRLDHLPGMAVVRREAFSNDQWSVAGAQLDRAEYPGGPFSKDPSQIVAFERCPTRWPTLDSSLRLFPRAAFDYLWLIEPPAYDHSLMQGMVPVWSNGRSTLYRIVDHRQPVSRSTDTWPAATT